MPPSLILGELENWFVGDGGGGGGVGLFLGVACFKILFIMGIL